MAKLVFLAVILVASLTLEVSGRKLAEQPKTELMAGHKKSSEPAKIGKELEDQKNFIGFAGLGAAAGVGAVGGVAGGLPTFGGLGSGMFSRYFHYSLYTFCPFFR
ncbi:hypothetical protein AMTR_s00067p00153670 [Amborella trichopoda]|uniref:Glycine-rich protein n=1 Tax=Amborella trichopoda TaxID=13333 RepID=U5DEP5_AMBTC|nr:hypothetical protein AMTR_s00067p00153670 [Amborella trichopoda]